MKTKIFKSVALFAVLAFTGIQYSCIKEDSEEIRFYVTDSTPADSYFITELYIVESPAGSNQNWGSNILNGNTKGPNGWQLYSYEPGVYDIKIVYWGKMWSSDPITLRTETDYNHELANTRGLKYDLDGYTLYTTHFSFSE
ncbi:MAG: hypothetical protein RBT49_15970 [Bacteroidales bacterium]|jgi:hypothetical protein|nr:hypothetical protein [Bacteroidales bacterium]